MRIVTMRVRCPHTGTYSDRSVLVPIKAKAGCAGEEAIDDEAARDAHMIGRHRNVALKTQKVGWRRAF
jgi:hypothetical protein